MSQEFWYIRHCQRGTVKVLPHMWQVMSIVGGSAARSSGESAASMAIARSGEQRHANESGVVFLSSAFLRPSFPRILREATARLRVGHFLDHHAARLENLHVVAHRGFKEDYGLALERPGEIAVEGV